MKHLFFSPRDFGRSTFLWCANCQIFFDISWKILQFYFAMCTSTESRRKKVETTTQISDKLIWLSSHLHVWQFVTKWKFTSAPFHMTSFQLTNFSAKGKKPSFFLQMEKKPSFFFSIERFSDLIQLFLFARANSVKQEMKKWIDMKFYGK